MAKQNTSPINSGELSSRDLAILQHVVLYRLTFTPPVQRLFFADEHFDHDHNKALATAGDALAKLCERGYLKKAHAGKPLRFNKAYGYYILSKQGAKAVQAPNHRATVPTALSADLAILWLCTMQTKRFHRVEREDLAKFLPEHDMPHQNIKHVISEHQLDDQQLVPLLHRVYVASMEIKKCVKYARKHFYDARKNESLQPMVDRGDYGFVILVPTLDRREELSIELKKASGKDRALHNLCRVTALLGPTPQTLNQALKSLKGTSS